MTTFDDILKELCTEKNIKLTKISKNWINVLERDKEIHYIVGHKFDLNNSALATILDDKYAFYELMELKNNPIIKHHIIFKNYDKLYIKNLFEKYNNNIVIKANLGTCGKEVFNTKTLNETYELLDKLLIKNYSLSICPYIDIKNEYRVIILDGQIMLIYGKIKPAVIGDGKKSIAELLKEFNPHFFNNKLNLLETVLKSGEKYEYNWQFNLSKGANIFMDIPEFLEKRISTLAQKVASEINIRFCSIDIIITNDDNIYLMEANSGVMMDNFLNIHPKGKNIAKFIYGIAINKMFEK